METITVSTEDLKEDYCNSLKVFHNSEELGDYYDAAYESTDAATTVSLLVQLHNKGIINLVVCPNVRKIWSHTCNQMKP